MTPEEYYATHQHAFRTAFDFLNSHFPPGTEPGWWEQASNDILKVSEGKGQLAQYLLIGVYDYLNEEYRRRMGYDSAESGKV